MLMLSDAARLVGGVLIGKDAWVMRVVTDSRNIRPGDLFIALRGQRFDAHDFVTAALRQGAVGAMVDASYVGQISASIQVDDTRLALGRLAHGWRCRFSLPLVGITGSNGKTTVKEMLVSILQRVGKADEVLATRGNLNNEIGLPLTLLELRETHRYAVVEMGMNHPGEIDYLTRIARPHVALVNNALRAHLGNFTSTVDIAHAKAEIFNGLNRAGFAVINQDDAHLNVFTKATMGHSLLRFGLSSGDIYARDLALLPDSSRFTVITPQSALKVALSVPGKHNVYNALATIALALALDIPNDLIVAGLAAYQGMKGRLMRCRAVNGATIIDDTYNANPDSMKAGLDVLANAPSPRVFIMGDIGELGRFAPDLHAEVGAYAREKGIDTLLTLGHQSYYAATSFGEEATHFDSLEALLAWLACQLSPSATVLIKGSRFMRMERIVDHLCGDKKEGAIVC